MLKNDIIIKKKLLPNTNIAIDASIIDITANMNDLLIFCITIYFINRKVYAIINIVKENDDNFVI